MLMHMAPALRDPSCSRAPAPARTVRRRMSPAALAAWLARQGFPGTDGCGENGETPLMRAAHRGHVIALDALLARGCAADTVDDDGNTALWFACLRGESAAILRLIEAGAKINHTNDDEYTCLMQAAASGQVETMRLLLAVGARTDLVAPDGRSALDMAAERGRQLLATAARLASPASAATD